MMAEGNRGCVVVNLAVGARHNQREERPEARAPSRRPCHQRPFSIPCPSKEI